MSLKHERDPVAAFIECGERYLSSPGVMTGMALDDAAVVLKRHLYSLNEGHPAIERLNAFARQIRNQQVDELREGFAAVLAAVQAD